MATISFKDTAPKFDGEARFALAGNDFSLAEGASFDSENPDVISAAEVHPWLKVEFPAVDVEASFDYNPEDPHDNPSVDHLSPLASQETKDAAAAADKAIQDVAFPDEATRFARPLPEDAPAPANVTPNGGTTPETPNGGKTVVVEPDPVTASTGSPAAPAAPATGGTN